jgi:hypothetical protein
MVASFSPNAGFGETVLRPLDLSGLQGQWY